MRREAEKHAKDNDIDWFSETFTDYIGSSIEKSEDTPLGSHGLKEVLLDEVTSKGVEGDRLKVVIAITGSAIEYGIGGCDDAFDRISFHGTATITIDDFDDFEIETDVEMEDLDGDGGAEYGHGLGMSFD